MKSTTGTGNKCGHQRDSPRFFSAPEKHANRPEIIRRAQIALREYYAKPGTFPLLNAANGSDRQQRSERREACIDMLACILHYTDLVTLRVAIPQSNGSTAGLTMPYMSNLATLGERRAERAVRDLKAAGIITVHPICKKLVDATYKGIAAIRTVSKHFFTALGFGDWLGHERRKAKERKIQRESKKSRKALAHIQMGINAAKLSNKGGESARTGKLSSVSEHIAAMRAFLKPTKSPPD